MVQPLSWIGCAAALPYSGPWPALIASFKYQGEVGLARAFAQQMRQQPSVQRILNHVDGLVPVPLSRDKLRWRGYNQSQWLAHHLSAARTLPEALLRVRDTPAQAGLSLAERQHNLDNAITWNPKQAMRLKGQRLALVDDVMTSGSTLSACAQALWQAGAAQVDCLVLARAGLSHAPQSGSTP
jgi:ComF family protein